MNKILRLTFVALIAFIGVSNLFADEYTVTFKDCGGTSDSGNKETTIDGLIATGGSIFSEVAADNVYQARAGRGVKLGSGSKPGSMEFTLSTKLNIQTIKFKARKYNDTETSITVNGKAFTELTGDFDEYTIELNGAETEKISISTPEKRAYITSLTILTPGGGGGGGTTPEVWSASSLTFDPDTKILQEAVKSENKGASFVIPEDANIFPTGTWETANATGDISPITNWLAAQGNPSLYATALREFTFTASTASVSMKAVSTPNTDSSDAEAWQNDVKNNGKKNMGLDTDACKIKWDSYVKPKTGNPSLGYYDFIETTEQGTAHRVYDDIWKIGCGKAPGKGTYYEFTFAKAGSMVMGVFMNRPNQSAVVVVDKETLNPLPYTDLSFEGFCQDNTFKYPDNGAESTDPTYQKFNFREDYTIDVSAQPGRPLLGYLSFPVEAKTYLVFQPSSQVGIYGFQFTAGGDPSGVETIKTEKVWNANAPMYNLSGQKVDKSYKGIVIQNGRKFVNK